MLCPKCGTEKHFSLFPRGGDSVAAMKRELGKVVCKECWNAYKYNKRKSKEDFEKEHGRLCPLCNTRKPLEYFYYRPESSASVKNAHKKKRNTYCIECHKERAKLQGKNRATNLPLRYGISVQDFEVLAESGCQICGAQKGDRVLVVDHEHDPIPGKPVFRGILCSQCNSGIGFFSDNPDLIYKAAYYLAQVKHGSRKPGVS